MATLRPTISPSWVTRGRPFPTSVPPSVALTEPARAGAEGGATAPGMDPAVQPATVASSSRTPSRAACRMSGSRGEPWSVTGGKEPTGVVSSTGGSALTGSLTSGAPDENCTIMSLSSCTRLRQWIMYLPWPQRWIPNCISTVTDSFSPR